MRLSWNEICARAAHFAEEWKDADYEKGETQTFYNEFFEVFGVRRKVATFEEPVKRLGTAWIHRPVLERRSAGRAEKCRADLRWRKQQALDYFPGLKDTELPRYILI